MRLLSGMCVYVLKNNTLTNNDLPAIVSSLILERDSQIAEDVYTLLLLRKSEQFSVHLSAAVAQLAPNGRRGKQKERAHVSLNCSHARLDTNDSN